eukprot:11731709-Karenia_brevis.AAC.1
MQALWIQPYTAAVSKIGSAEPLIVIKFSISAEMNGFSVLHTCSCSWFAADVCASQTYNVLVNIHDSTHGSAGYNPVIRTSPTTDMNEKLWMLTAGSILLNLNILHHWQCRNCAARKSWPCDLYSRPGCERN